MTGPEPVETEGIREQLRASERDGPAPRWQSPGRLAQRRLGELALLFVVVSLFALVAVPILMDRRIEPVRGEIHSTIDPARTLVGAIQAYLSFELSLVRGYLLSGDEQALADYARVHEEHQQAYEELLPLVVRMGSEVEERYWRLRTLAERRHEPFTAFMRGEISREEYVGGLPDRQVLFEEALVAAHVLDAAIRQEELSLRGRVQSLRDANNLITIVLGMLALAATVIVGWMARTLRRRAEAEIALGRVAHALAGALSGNQILRWIADEALTITRADAAFVERIDFESDEVEIVAGAGRAAPPPGTRLDLPGSLTDEMVRTGKPRSLVLREISTGPIAPHLADRCRGCSALVVPLVAGERTFGALVLLRGRGRRTFRREQITRACALSDLASLTMSKLILLERSQAHRAEMEQLLSTRSRLVRGISHDLKNPLGAADGYTALLEDGLRGELNPEQKEFIGRIRRLHRSMLDIIQNLLDAARLETGELSVDVSETDVTRILRETAEDYQARAEIARLELHVTLPDEPLVIRTDPVRVREIVGNLLTNAINYTPAGSVHLRAERRQRAPSLRGGPWLAIEVQDTGPGIPEDERERVFEEFRRLEGSGTGGSGIGLSISRRIARMLKGDVTIDSAPGRGSVFTLWLPAGGEE